MPSDEPAEAGAPSVLGLAPAIVMAAGMFAWFSVWWFVLPLGIRARHLDEAVREPDGDP